MKTRNVSLVAIGIVLIAAVMVSFLISRNSVFTQKREMPVFMGEEMVVQKGAEEVRGVEKAIEVKKAVKTEVQKAVKTVSKPVPQPKVATPLPIMPPSISYRLLPEYPVSALEQGLQGTTILSIYVGLNGAAEKIEIKSSSGFSELDRSALTAVSQWKFNPATQGGSAVASWFELPVRFKIK